jgi:hypothetical protein
MKIYKQNTDIKKLNRLGEQQEIRKSNKSKFNSIAWEHESFGENANLKLIQIYKTDTSDVEPINSANPSSPLAAPSPHAQ